MLDSTLVFGIAGQARNLFNAEDFRGAEMLLDSALSLARRDSTLGLTWIHFQQGVTSMQTGGFDKALEQFKRGLYRLEANRDTTGIGKIHYRIGCVYHQLGNAGEALRYFLRAENTRDLTVEEGAKIALPERSLMQRTGSSKTPLIRSTQ